MERKGVRSAVPVLADVDFLILADPAAQRAIADVLAARYERNGCGEFGAEGIVLRYLDAGDHGRAIDWPEKSHEDRDPNLQYIGLPLYDPLRSNPRFQDLLRRTNLPED